ncbi:FAD-dependent monooxygenase [Salinispira pacifica]
MAEKTGVLIVGAGPTGLLLACLLARHGVSFQIIDKLKSPRKISKAAGVMPRTLEVLHGIGAAERFVRAGNRVERLTLMERRNGGPTGSPTSKTPAPLLEISFDHLDSPYPFIIGLEQFRTEELLTETLESFGGRVERGVELVDFTENGGNVRAWMVDASGNTRETDCSYIVGCDGAHSTVRHKLGLPFEGSQDSDHYVVGYLKIDWDMPSSKMFEFNSQEGTIFGIPLPEGRWSVAAEYDRSQWRHDGDAEPELAELQELFDRRSPLRAKLSDPRWMSYYRVNHRQVPRYREGRAFLAGDAAHVHSPVGGQGMNTGLQDAANLAWKLGFACRGFGGEELLESYNAERHPVGRSVVHLTSFLQAELNLRSRLAMALRNEMTELVGRAGYLRNLASRQLGELAFHYRRSPIVAEHAAGSRLAVHHARHTDLSECPDFSAGPHAGDRAPDAAIVGSVDGTSGVVSLYDLLDPTRYLLLLFEGTHAEGDGSAGTEKLEALAARLPERVQGLVKTVVVALQPADADPAAGAVTRLLDSEGVFHHRYAARGECLYLIRPDGYIGFRCEPPDLRLLLERFGGVGEPVPNR